jgi:ABC-type transporter MlaC component
MNKTILRFLLIVFIVAFGVTEAKALEPNDTVLRYFKALQQGDISTIKDSITGEMYQKNKAILDQNENYPVYLQKAYQGAKFQITDTTVRDNDVVVTVKVNFPDRQKEFVLLLKKDDSGNWKIYKENRE